MLITAVAAVCLAAAAWSIWGPRTTAGAAAAKYAPPDGDYYLGVSTDIAALPAFTQAAGLSSSAGSSSSGSAGNDGAHPAIFDQWTTPDGPVQPILANARTRPGMAPMISWNLPLDGGRVASGSQDAYLSAQAAAVKAYGGPVFVRLDWEMNATWYPQWNVPAVSPAAFIAGWRHVYDVFQRVGADNAAFVWCPTLWNGPDGLSPQTWYPGDAYVDWTGVDAYPQSAVADFILTGPGGLDDSAAFAAAHGKPLMIAEWAPALPQPDTAAAMDLVFAFAAAHPTTVKALVYFDFATGGKDYRLASHPVGAADFRKRVDGNPHVLLTVPGP